MQPLLPLVVNCTEAARMLGVSDEKFRLDRKPGGALQHLKPVSYARNLFAIKDIKAIVDGNNNDTTPERRKQHIREKLSHGINQSALSH